MARRIKIVHCHAKEELKSDVTHSCEPLLLKGLVNSWPIVEKGLSSFSDAKEYIAGFDNQRTVGAFKTEARNKGRFFYNEDYTGLNFEFKHRLLNDVLNDIEQHQGDDSLSLYVGSTSVDTCIPGFRKDNDLLFENCIKPLVSLWLGNRSRIAAHYDAPMNIACNAVGRRRFTLFPPTQIKNLYIGPLDFTPAGQAASLVDFANPDFQKFPDFEKALEESFVVELEPGDAILIPSMWWHHVEGLESFNVLINYWWRTAPAHAGPGISALQHAILTLRDLPKPERDAWKELFDYYIFGDQEKVTRHIPEHVHGVLAPLDDNRARKLRSQLLASLKR